MKMNRNTEKKIPLPLSYVKVRNTGVKLYKNKKTYKFRRKINRFSQT